MSRSAKSVLLVACAAAVAATAAGTVLMRQAHQADSLLADRLAPTTAWRGTPVDCPRPPAARKHAVVLALGQSNAANHGERSGPRPTLLIFHRGRCGLATDPVPGATGDGASVWPDLAATLAPPVLFSVLAVDATSIDEWTRSGSPLRQALTAHVQAMRERDLLPDLILWQQGEADARRGTSTKEYRRDLQALRSIVDEAGAVAPIIVAYSTVCRSEPNTAIRQAIDAETTDTLRLRRGPDLDRLRTPALRHDGCHFSAAGLAQAAGLWREAIAAVAPSLAP